MAKKSESKKAEPDTSPERANERVQEVVEGEQEQGFRGVEVDPTDNHAYTVEGVTSGEPTPETDPKAAEKAGSRRFA